MKNNKLWCSSHHPTKEQLESLGNNVIFLQDIRPDLSSKLSNCPTDRRELMKLAEDVFSVALDNDATIVQLGGSPMFLFIAGAVINGCLSRQIITFAHSERQSMDIPQPDGSVKKVSIFKHLGWL